MLKLKLAATAAAAALLGTFMLHGSVAAMELGWVHDCRYDKQAQTATAVLRLRADVTTRYRLVGVTLEAYSDQEAEHKIARSVDHYLVHDHVRRRLPITLDLEGHDVDPDQLECTISLDY
jgi:riboflavin synthase